MSPMMPAIKPVFLPTILFGTSTFFDGYVSYGINVKERRGIWCRVQIREGQLYEKRVVR